MSAANNKTTESQQTRLVAAAKWSAYRHGLWGFIYSMSMMNLFIMETIPTADRATGQKFVTFIILLLPVIFLSFIRPGDHKILMENATRDINPADLARVKTREGRRYFFSIAVLAVFYGLLIWYKEQFEI